jgi:hypothetical protein
MTLREFHELERKFHKMNKKNKTLSFEDLVDIALDRPVMTAMVDSAVRRHRRRASFTQGRHEQYCPPKKRQEKTQGRGSTIRKMGDGRKMDYGFGL